MKINSSFSLTKIDRLGLIFIFLDLIFTIFTIYSAYFVRLNMFYYIRFYDINLTIIVLSFLNIFIFYFFGIYNQLIQYFNLNIILRIICSCIIISVISIFLITIFSLQIPRSIPIISSVFFCLITIFSRLLVFNFINFHNKNKNNRERSILFGAGEAGFQLLGSAKRQTDYDIQAIIDDDPNKQYRSIFNFNIFPREEIRTLIDRFEIDSILVAITDIDSKKRKLLYEYLSQFNVKVKFLPQVNEYVSYDYASFSDLQKLDINDLLMRNINISLSEIKSKIENKVILISGAGGSIGSELCIESINFMPSKIILLDHSEFNLYRISELLKKIRLKRNLNFKIISILSSVKDRDRIMKVFEDYHPEIVYHSAAYKHVSLVDDNMIEAVNNNIFGTLNIIDAAIRFKAQRFVLVSTDKAVRPSNIMGASKRFAELLIQAKSHIQESKDTILSIVRFGNVLGSSGSVIPIFSDQIREGGPITVRDPNVTRYFMTINEAAKLILEADSIATGGEVFVLNMGEPIKILDLAKKMIKLSGNKVQEDKKDPGIAIKFTGLLKSEKMHEELLIGKNPSKTSNPDIMMANEKFIDWNILSKKLHQINQHCINGDIIQLVELLEEITELKYER